MKKEYDVSRGDRGAVAPSPGKTRITIRIDNEILDWFRKAATRAAGGSYQTMVNAALREFIRGQDLALEDTLRRVIREELGRR